MQTIKLNQLKEVLTCVKLANTTIYTPQLNYTISIQFDRTIRLVRIEDRRDGLVAIDCNYNSTLVTWDTEVVVEVSYKTEHVFA